MDEWHLDYIPTKPNKSKSITVIVNEWPEVQRSRTHSVIGYIMKEKVLPMTSSARDGDRP